jgi:sugar diacid utilization regulator
MLAVARANGRIAPAARILGVHRNTVLYRLRRALAEYGLDPRRPADALRLLKEADRVERHDAEWTTIANECP